MSRLALQIFLQRLWVAFGVSVVVLGPLLAQPVYAISKDDLQSINYNTPFYDPYAQTCEQAGLSDGSRVSNLVGTDTAQKIYMFLVGKGLTAVDAAAVMGNLRAESGLDPKIVEGKAVAELHLPQSKYDNMPDAIRDPTGGHAFGYGLAQWTSYGRQQGLIDAAAAAHTIQGDLGTQLNYLWQEMTTTRAQALKDLKTNQSQDGEGANNNWEGSATILWMKEFESPQDTPATRSARHGYASQYYALYSKSTVSPAVASTSDGTSYSQTTSSPDASASSSQCGQFTASTSFLDNFTEYKQCDDRGDNNYKAPWQNAPYGTSTVCNAGCGPSAMAMIITNLTGQHVTPDMTAAYGNDPKHLTQGCPNDCGSYRTIPYTLAANSAWGIQVVEQFGVNTAGHISKYDMSQPSQIIDEINAQLNQGALILIAEKAAAQYTHNGFDSATSLTEVGHYIVIRAVTADHYWLEGNSITGIGNDLNPKNSFYKYKPEDFLTHSQPGEFNAWVIKRK